MATGATAAPRSRLALDPVGEAISRSREFIRRALSELGRTELEDSAVLGVSELVTNAALHARTPMEITITGTARGVRIGVRDHSARLPTPRHYGVEAETGRGLRLVSAVSSAWGVDVDAHGGGKVVWFEPMPEPTSDSFAPTEWLTSFGESDGG